MFISFQAVYLASITSAICINFMKYLELYGFLVDFFAEGVIQ